jgi:hypothetical protein
LAVIAKFKVNEITRGMHVKDYSTGEKVEKQTIKLNPVYSQDPNHENKTFWDATPSGSISLDVINPEAWGEFELGAEMYVTFERASKGE